MLMQNLGEQTKCIMVFSKITYCCYSLLCQCCNVGRLLLLAMHLPLLLSQLLSLPLTVSPTVSVVTPVAANTAFPLATVLATYTDADVTIVGNVILPNNLLLGLLL